MLAKLCALALIAAACAWAPVGAQAFVFGLSVTNTRESRPIADDFLGLALEYRAVPGVAGSDDPAQVNPALLQLVRNLVPAGRPVLRIGGQSADRTWWPIPGYKRPLGITYDLTANWMASARALARAMNARLILGVGLEANRPRIDQVEAGELLKGIGRQYLDALEIGNEPELYTLVPWYLMIHGAPVPWYSQFGTPVFARPASYGFPSFTADFSNALRVLPRVPIAGPDTGILSWLDGFRRFLGRRSRVRAVTWHDYGLNQCVTDPASPQYPTVPNLLSNMASRATVGDIGPDVAAAHQAGATFRIDEMGSISCNGRPGVSNTFASALWVMDALFTIAADGVDGVNLHTYPNSVNGLFDFARSHGQLQATVHPLYYGALMFARAAPPGSRLLQIDSGPQTALRAWATLAPDHRIRVLLINDSLTLSALARVRTPVAPGPASLERLRAASPYATGGVTLGGQSFGAVTTTGVLPDRPASQSVTPHAGTYAVTLPAGSAALLTVAPGGHVPG